MIAPATPDDISALVALWTQAGLTRPWNDPVADARLALAGASSAILVARSDGAIAASAMVGHDGHRGWVYYLAVDEGFRRQGLGRAMMDACEAWVRERGIPKLALMIREGNTEVAGFYAALGYTQDAVMVLGKRFEAAPT